MMDGVAAPKMPPPMKMSRLCTPWLCVIHRRRNLRSIDSEVDIRFGAVQSILTNILGMSKVSARWVPGVLTDDQKSTWHDISMFSCLALKMTPKILASEL